MKSGQKLLPDILIPMRHILLSLAASASLLVQTSSLPAQQPVKKEAKPSKPTSTQWDLMDPGAFLSSGLQVPGAAADRTRPALKGVSIRVGPNQEATMCFDTERCRMAIGWTGGFLKLPTGREGLEGVPQPAPDTSVTFSSAVLPGWADKDGNFVEPKPPVKDGGELVSFGPLPKAWAHWRGLYVNGKQVVLSYTVGGTSVLELPGFHAASKTFTRTFQIDNFTAPLTLLVCDDAAKPEGRTIAVSFSESGARKVKSEHITTAEGRRLLKLTPLAKSATFTVGVWSGPAAELEAYHQGPKPPAEPPDLKKLIKGGAANWNPVIETKGALGMGDGPYVVDTLTIPDGKDNPWNSWIRTSGFDFFKDATKAALCSVSGDVWLVSGIDDTLAHLKWKRFATGLFQPLGLKIVDGKVYVLGRDQITRLHDLNGDGETDFYENFNNDVAISSHYHEFCLGLETDSKGNFYFNKGGNLGGAKHQHHGVLARVSKDGGKLEVVATGYRAPNGLGIGPNDEITSSDNEGNWVPSSRVNLMKPGGFYGHVFTAHQPQPPTDYDKPILWLPHQVDNSSGGQVWVTSDKWGPFQGDLLHLSYGSCSLFKVMMEFVGGQVQGGAVRFPLNFDSGIMRGRFNARDGQLYLAGLRVWQSNGARTGTFQRVRYTGKPVVMPREMHVKSNGIEITFTGALDSKSAADDQNWAIDQWNYKWKQDYGSKMYSVTEPDKVIGENKVATQKFGGEDVALKGIKVSPDKRTVFIETAALQPVMQMRIRFNLQAADGSPVNQTVFNTINKIAAK